MKTWLMQLLLPCLLVACVVDEHEDKAVPDESSIVRVGDRLPVFSVEVTDGSEHSVFNSNSLEGTTVIVFFNTSCQDCQRELPELNAYYLRHCQDQGFTLLTRRRLNTASHCLPRASISSRLRLTTTARPSS